MSQPDAPDPLAPQEPKVAFERAEEHINPEMVNRDPTEEEYEQAHVEGEFISIRGGYVLLTDGTTARIQSYHDENGRQVYHIRDAVMACAGVNGLLFAYPLSLAKTVH